jgi:hypothetical protein
VREPWGLSRDESSPKQVWKREWVGATGVIFPVAAEALIAESEEPWAESQELWFRASRGGVALGMFAVVA